MSDEPERCCICDALTGRTFAESMYLHPINPDGNDLGPLCCDCYDELWPEKPEQTK